MEKAKVLRRGKRARLTIDVAESLVNELDEIRRKIGVDRGALIEIWSHERVLQEKAAREAR
jgi:metal-responsive CopG/Arc/MetJ family transcriptional regulator